LVEHSTENAGVVGSIPSLGTFRLPEITLRQATRGPNHSLQGKIKRLDSRSDSKTQNIF
jgi:hypothetical protein